MVQFMDVMQRCGVICTLREQWARWIFLLLHCDKGNCKWKDVGVIRDRELWWEQWMFMIFGVPKSGKKVTYIVQQINGRLPNQLDINPA